MISRRRWMAMFVCTLVWLACPRMADAAICTWTGAGLNNLWSNPFNWDNCGGAHAIPQDDDLVFFPHGAPQPENVNNIAGLELFNLGIGTAAGGVRYRITGERITVTNQLLFQGSSDTTGPELLTPLTLGDDIRIENIGGGTAEGIIGGDIDLNGHDLDVEASTGPIVFSGVISGSGGTLIIDGFFDTRLTGANTYDGLTRVEHGNVVVETATALGAAPGGVLSGHTIIQRDGSVTIAPGLTVAESFKFMEPPITGEPPTLRLPAGEATLTGTFATGSQDSIFAVDAGATLHIPGVIAFAQEGTLVKSGAGVLIISASGDQGFATRIRGGVLRLAASGALPDTGLVSLDGGTVLDLNGVNETIGWVQSSAGTIMLGSGTLTINQVAAGSIEGPIVGSGNLVKTGQSTLRLEGVTPNTFTGLTTVMQAALELDKTTGVAAIRGNVLVNGGTLRWINSHQIDDGASVAVNTPSTLEMGAHEEAIGALTGTGGVTFDGLLAVGGTHASSLYAGTFSGTGILTKAGSGTLTLTATNASSGPSGFYGRADVAGGTLLVNGTLPGVLLIGGVVGGTGNAGPVVASVLGGGVSPGTSPGILGTSSAALQTGAVFTVELNGAIPGTGYDRLTAAGGVALSGATLSASLGLGFVPAVGTTFTIIDVGVGPVDGTFAGLPQDAGLVIGGRPFRISYTGGDGNDVVLTALALPEISISDVTVVEGQSGSTDAVFTVSLSTAPVAAVNVDYATVNGTAASPQDFASQNGTLVFQAGQQSKTVTVAVQGDTVDEPTETFVVRLSNVQGAATIVDTDGVGTITNDDTPTTLTWYLAEGATGVFFDNDLLIANPTTTAAPVTLTFFPEGGSPIVDQRTIPAQSRVTIHVDQLPGLENASAAVQVVSTNAIPLVVERTMFWDATYYGGHTGAAVTQASPTWFFAEASQGFFSTYVLITNANTTAADVTLTFLREGEPPVVKTVPVGASSRLTIDAGTFSEVVNRSFGLSIDATQPVIAERAMYFGSTSTKLWSGGHESPGVTQPATNWFIAEGATGSFFDTYILLSNPSDDEAHVTLDFLLEDGANVRVLRTVPAKGRVTVDIEGQNDPRLKAGAVSTVVASDRPIVSERSTYWGGDATPWGEGHNSFGLTETSSTWGLAEGRVGGAHNFVTFILLANPQTTEANVTVTYLRETGAPIVKTYTLLPQSRFTIGVNSAVPELHDEAFGARIDVMNGVQIAVERSMYWDANGVFWAGGSHAPATRLP